MPLARMATSVGLRQWFLCLPREAASPVSKQGFSRTPQTCYRSAASLYSQRRHIHRSSRTAAPVGLVSLLQPNQQPAAGINLCRCARGYHIRQQRMHRSASPTAKKTTASLYMAASAVMADQTYQQSGDALQGEIDSPLRNLSPCRCTKRLPFYWYAWVIPCTNCHDQAHSPIEEARRGHMHHLV